MNATSGIRGILPRPRPDNPLPVDIGVALGLLVLGAIDLRSRAAGGQQVVVGGAVAVLGATLLGLYSATVPAGSRSSIRGFVLAAVALAGATLAGPHPSLADLVPLSLPFAVFVLGRLQASRQLQAEMTRERAAKLEREQEERARAAIADERTRIARELHDVIAHSVGVMVVQAQGAERVLDADPRAARAALKIIASTGRDAVAEMHRVVGMLRSSPDGDGLAPQPGLDQLDALLQQTRDAGLPVEASIEGAARPLSPGIDLAAYRVVQEALTNVRKHAGPARARVTLRYRDRALEIEVTDDGKGSPEHADGSGQGLIGMRERVGLYGGSFSAGRRPSDGYAVFASFPLEASRP